MHEDRPAVEPEIVGVRALRAWITGEGLDRSRVFFVDAGATAEDLEEVADRGDVILVPEASRAYGRRAATVHYRGALAAVGDELFFGERSVELQDYVAAAFVQIVGPTAVCFSDASGWQAFLVDAELARETGVFPAALIDPRVILADRGALSQPNDLVTPRAFRVHADGRVSIGMQGEVIGEVGELPTLLTRRQPGVAALGGIAPRAEMLADLSDRRWIGRYLLATDLVKMLGLANGAARISGFGWSLVEDDLADAESPTGDPFLLETADGYLLADPGTLRRQLLSPVTAEVVAIVQTSHTPEVAASRAARRLGTPASEARLLCLDAVAALDVHFGRRIDASCRTAGIRR